MRLADTELALYEALATLRTMNGPSLVRASKKAQISPKQKAARMEEWTQFPLHEPSDLERWLEAKSDQFTIINNVREQRTMFSIEANNRDAGFRPHVQNFYRNRFTGRLSIKSTDEHKPSHFAFNSWWDLLE
ncbi:uncharacterized protein CDV56_105931 [Aspergillus thermomutatus]|uniref:Uncharacterized protein n=1 Tax=Aspergillus thermomutatus TaxID=41047 RepID=A0A397HV84_ASPTH|nr:uncharacterized protein CDV56_105931 [Aspergillus thermomutatus]RHZ67135.1 hypothetical protein CDV56_105931 [Aspergillus thermomutatus]